MTLRSLVYLTLALLLSTFLPGCDGTYRRVTWEDHGYWVGFDIPKGMVRSGGGWNRKKNNRYIIQTHFVDLSRTRPDMQIREAISMLEVEPEPGGKDHQQRVRDINFALDDWGQLHTRVSSPEFMSQFQVLMELKPKAEELRQRFEKNPSLEDKTNKRLLNEIMAGVETITPKAERHLAAYNLAYADTFTRFSLEKMELEEIEVDLAPCRVIKIDYKDDKNVYAFYPVDEKTVYIYELREVKSNDLEQHLEPLIQSVRIGLMESDVQGDNPLRKLLLMMPKTSHKTNRILLLLGFFSFCTILPASVSAFRNYPGHGGGEEKRRKCGIAVRKAVSRTSGCSLTVIATLVCVAIVAEVTSGRGFSLGLILTAVFCFLFAGLFWLVTLIAAFGAGAGAEKGARLNKVACVAYAVGGAVAGALAVLLLMALSGV